MKHGQFHLWAVSQASRDFYPAAEMIYGRQIISMRQDVKFKTSKEEIDRLLAW